MCGCVSSKPVENGYNGNEKVTMSPAAADAIAKAAAKKMELDLHQALKYDYDFSSLNVEDRSFDKIDRVGLSMIFNKYDADGSGKIGTNEFRAALREVVGKDVPKDYVVRILEAFDKDKSGGIEKKEFEKMVATFGMLQRAPQKVAEGSGYDNKLKEAFKQYDQDNSGCIGREELTLALARAGLGQKEKITDLVLERFDADRSGDISFAEFQKLAASHEELIKCWNGDTTVADYSADVDETGKAGRVNGLVQDRNWKHEFDKYDSDGSGAIEKKELRKVLKHVGIQVDKKLVKDILSVYDVDGSGTIEFAEFRMLVSNCERFSKIENQQDGYVKDVFKKFDQDNDGKLRKAEVQGACRESGLHVDSKVAQKILDQFDSDHAGSIDFKTFAQIVATCEVLGLGSTRQEIHPPPVAIERVFKEFDVDGSGFIERQELNMVFERAGLDTSSKDLKLIMAKYEEDSSCGLSLSQFAQVVESYKTLSAFVGS